MKEIGKAETIEELEEQISYLEDILSTMEDLQILYGKNLTFKDDYKDVQNQIKWIEEVQDDLTEEKEELERLSEQEYSQNYY